MPITHAFVPDTQVRDGVPTKHLEAAGNYIAEKKPDVIIQIGDWADMPSLSGWDPTHKKVADKRKYLDGGKGSAKGDIGSANEAFSLFNRPIAKAEKKGYKPRKIITLGNHEHRITRFKDENPHLGDAVCLEHLRFADWGYQVVPFLKPICINGIHYAHYFHPPNSPRPYGGMVANVLPKIGYSYSMGHVQGKDAYGRYLTNGRVIRGLRAGSFYMHKEDYAGYQGNEHWHGILFKHEVKHGNYDLMEISLKYLINNYL